MKKMCSNSDRFLYSAFRFWAGAFGIICLLLTNVSAREHNCCDQGLMVGKNCVEDGKLYEVDLQCSYGQYVIDPETDPMDSFVIDSYGLLRFTEVDGDIPFSRYCTALAENNYKNGTKKIAVICFDQFTTDRTLFVIKGVLAFISVGFLLVTLGIYWMIKSLRDTHDKVTICCLACLTALFTLLGILQMYTGTTEQISCHVLAFFTYFFIMAYFSWLNMVSANVLKMSLLRKWKITERNWYILNHIYGWTVPTVCTIILGISHSLNLELGPGIGHNSCWLKGAKETWIYLYTPMAIMLFFNIMCFALTCWGLYKIWDSISSERKRSLKYKCQLYFKLFMLCGITWIFELLSYAFKKWNWYWLITDGINALHGFFIFLILIVFRKRIRRELGGKKVCCFPITKEWAKVVPSEDVVSTESKDIHLQTK